MLRIRSEQAEALRAPFRDKTRTELSDHAHSCFPEEVSEMGEESLSEVIDLTLQKAESYKIAFKRDLLKFFNVVLIFGIDFDEGPETDWMKEILADMSTPKVSDRVQKLHDAALYHLEVEENKRKIEEKYYSE